MKTGEIRKEARELKKDFMLIMWCVKYLRKINNYLKIIHLIISSLRSRLKEGIRINEK